MSPAGQRTRQRQPTAASTVAVLISPVLISTLLISAALTGCADQAPEDNPTGQTEAADRFATISISYSEEGPPGAVRPRFSIGAQFSRRTGSLTRAAVRALLDLPENPGDLDVAVGHCVIGGRDFGSQVLPDEELSLSLLDAGTLHLNAFGRSRALTRRSAGALVPGIAGLTYEGALAVRAAAAGGALIVTGSGAAQVGPFSVKVPVTPVPTILAVNGAPPSRGWSAINWDGPLEVDWPRAENAPAKQGTVLLDVEVLQFERHVVLRCRAPDTGRATLPASSIAQLHASVSDDTTVRLVARRMNETRFAVSGIHDATVMFTSRDSVLLR